MKKHVPETDVEFAGGFQNINPYNHLKVDYISNVNSNSSITAQYKAMIQLNGPYDLFMTLTFGASLGYLKRCQFTNRLLHLFNQMLFARDYTKKGIHLRGFAFFEDHMSSALEGPHVHMLLKVDRTKRRTFIEYEDIFRKAASKVRNGEKAVFNNKCIDIQEAGDDGRIGYCTKHIWDRNVKRIKIVGENGISDNLWHVDENFGRFGR